MLCLLKLLIITIDFCLFTSNYRKVQGAVASWLVPLSPDPSGLGSSPGQGHCGLYSWPKHVTLTVPLSTQV